MNAKLLIIALIIASIGLAGCQLASTTTKPEVSKVESSVKPSIKPSVTPINKDEAEVKGIGSEFDNIDAARDFPDFTQNDLQQ